MTVVANLRSLNEAVAQSNPNVDREAGIIRNVKIIGKVSKNGRIYTDEALDQATKLYEGIGVNVDHPDKDKPEADRKLADGFGKLMNVERRDDGVYGDLKYLKTHPLAEQVCEAAENMPDQLGLSHNASGTVRRQGDSWVVETVEEVRSVDLVRNPATNSGLFESTAPPDSEDKKMKKSFRALLKESVKSKGRPLSKGILHVLTEMEGDGLMDPDEEIVVQEMSDPVEVVKDQLAKKAVEIFKDDSIDPKTTAKKIETLGKAVENVAKEMNGEEVVVSEQDDEDEKAEHIAEMDDDKLKEQEGDGKKKDAEMPECYDDGKVRESAAFKKLQSQVDDDKKEIAELRESVEKSQRESTARKLCQKHGVEPTETMIEAVSALASESKMERFLESYPKQQKGGYQPPKSRQPLQESINGKKPYDPNDLKSVAKFLRS